ncbi:hypothetical protein FQN57_003350 [Myotisia sp. PD_48]|nr:hypothetical protein FQN57_003350 [Myotisia sp. PD_48]
MADTGVEPRPAQVFPSTKHVEAQAMPPVHDRRFDRRTSVYQKFQLVDHIRRKSWQGPPSEMIFGGISATIDDKNVGVALAIRDTTYFLDFCEEHFSVAQLETMPEVVGDYFIDQLRKYEQEHLEKFMGIAMPIDLAVKCPKLCSRLWRELDIVPIVLHGRGVHSVGWIHRELFVSKTLDEQAESIARKCITFFGPNQAPLLQVGFRGIVEVDAGNHAVLTNIMDYERTVSDRTWRSVIKYANDLKQRNVKIAFFSSTPQGGGVALMRHALVRFSAALGTDIKWFVPRPRPGVFRITKTNHNILQGVAKPGERLTEENKLGLTDWIVSNANRYWFAKGGPLVPPEEGGADVIIIDDPQMPGLIPLIKKVTPNRPVIYRSHIQIRSDLIAQPNSPQAAAWEFLWEGIRQADLFISHPVDAFVPDNVPTERVGYLPASTDWLDGLNKHMSDWDVGYYGRIFNSKCREIGMTTIDYPKDEYIVQVARFDPSKGIPDLLTSYAKFFDMVQNLPDIRIPKLVICGHGSVDDPDGSIVYDAAMEHISTQLIHLKDYICVIHIPPSDQILNAIMSKARIALQLSTREGFEVKVSEALHKGKPVIATKAGGIPLQVQDKKNGFLVEVGDTDAVAKHLYDLWTDDDLYERMSEYAAKSVSDEVSTVGNALSWLYLANEMSKGDKCLPHKKWIYDMARDTANEPHQPDPVAKKYFRIQPGHLAPHGSKYSKDEIKKRELDSEQKQRKESQRKRIQTERVKRARILDHPVCGSLGLGRETGHHTAWDGGIMNQRTMARANMLESRLLVDLGKHGANYCNQFVRDPRTGIILTGANLDYKALKPTSRSNFSAFRPIPSSEPWRYDEEIDKDAIHLSHREWITSMAITPMGNIMYVDHFQMAFTPCCSVFIDAERGYVGRIASHEHLAGTGVRLAVGKIVDPSEVYSNDGFVLDSLLISFRKRADWVTSAAACPSTTTSLFAIGCSRDLTFVKCEGSQSILDIAETFPADITALDWLGDNVVIAGLRNSLITLHDIRCKSSAWRMNHSHGIQAVKKVDDTKIVVAGVDQTLKMYDLRASRTTVKNRPDPNRKNHKSTTPYLTFNELNFTNLNDMDVSSDLGILACATNLHQVQLFSLHTGRLLEPLNSSNRPRTRIPSSRPSSSQRPTNIFSHSYSAPLDCVRFETMPEIYDSSKTSSAVGDTKLLVGSGQIIEEWAL